MSAIDLAEGLGITSPSQLQEPAHVRRALHDGWIQDAHGCISVK
jgi:hypothetical protein